MTEQLRIGIACFATYGGSGVVATELGREMARAGHRVHFISNQLPFRLQQGEFLENVYYHETVSTTYDVIPAAMFGFEIASKITQIALDEKLDLLHAHYAVPHAISGITAKQVLKPRELKIVTTLHGTDITLVGRHPAFFPLTKWAIEQSDAVTTVSHWLREETLRTFGIENSIHVIHNFVDTTRFSTERQACRRKHFAADNEKIILHVSNFRPVKRLDDVVHVFARIAESMPAKLVLIGDGPERERTLELARRLGVMDRTHFLGKQNLIEHYYAIADLLLFPSEYESFGITALEAMSASLPVVATTGSGLSEVVEEGVTGFLRPVGDVPALAEACQRILQDDALAVRMGQAGRRRAEQCFQAKAIAQSYLDLYRSVMNGVKYPPPAPCKPEPAVVQTVPISSSSLII
ncbi:MAG: N-acetyl-alpha-D-glucosaminyl L-malate synthase BshA [Candidatus Sumerlaeaceae bacterium]